jgi:hypothetical protein
LTTIEFLAKADERDHHFRDDRRAGDPSCRLDGSLEDGAGLHLGNFSGRRSQDGSRDDRASG